jgi:hypothetical protein
MENLRSTDVDNLPIDAMEKNNGELEDDDDLLGGTVEGLLDGTIKPEHDDASYGKFFERPKSADGFDEALRDHSGNSSTETED